MNKEELKALIDALKLIQNTCMKHNCRCEDCELRDNNDECGLINDNVLTPTHWVIRDDTKPPRLIL